MAHATASHTPTREMQAGIDECTGCHAVCLQTVRHCLEMGGPHAAAEHIITLLDCAEACRASANAMLVGSPRHGRVCALCAEACRACEESCRRFGNDATMKQCADTCQRCAESCERMARAA